MVEAACTEALCMWKVGSPSRARNSEHSYNGLVPWEPQVPPRRGDMFIVPVPNDIERRSKDGIQVELY